MTNPNNNEIISLNQLTLRPQLPIITHTCATPMLTPSSSSKNLRLANTFKQNSFLLKHLRNKSLDSSIDYLNLQKNNSIQNFHKHKSCCNLTNIQQQTVLKSKKQVQIKFRKSKNRKSNNFKNPAIIASTTTITSFKLKNEKNSNRIQQNIELNKIESSEDEMIVSVFEFFSSK